MFDEELEEGARSDESEIRTMKKIEEKKLHFFLMRN